MVDQPILKKTFFTVAVMLAAWGAFVGTVSVVAVLVTSHVVAAPDTSAPSAPSVTPADKPATPGGHGSSSSAPNSQRI